LFVQLNGVAVEAYVADRPELAGYSDVESSCREQSAVEAPKIQTL